MQVTIEKEPVKNSHIEEEDTIKLYLGEINKTRLLEFEEELELSKKIQKGDKSALEALIKANLRLVVKIAKHFVSKEYPLMDIIQDGNLGLIKAAEKYDHGKYVRFSTYAAWWIKQAIIRSLSIKKRMIRLPHRKEEKLRQIKKVWNDLYQKLRRIPKLEEIAEFMALDVEEIENLIAVGNTVVSFENNISSEEFPLINVIEDNSYSPDQIVMNEKLKEETIKVINSLIPKEKMVLLCRYGFMDGKKYTLKKMGDYFGISAETVRQIEIKALKKLRDKFGYLKDYLV